MSYRGWTRVFDTEHLSTYERQTWIGSRSLRTRKHAAKRLTRRTAQREVAATVAILPELVLDEPVIERPRLVAASTYSGYVIGLLSDGSVTLLD